ncbi:hypothetical protein ACHQM5_027224 [Ranunculus cassubicifolius]
MVVAVCFAHWYKITQPKMLVGIPSTEESIEEKGRKTWNISLKIGLVLFINFNQVMPSTCTPCNSKEILGITNYKKTNTIV